MAHFHRPAALTCLVMLACNLSMITAHALPVAPSPQPPPATDTVSTGTSDDTQPTSAPQSEAPETVSDAIVRLPPRGELREPLDPESLRELRNGRAERPREVRLVPGGGLILSFDSDGEGTISASELTDGITTQFALADVSADGVLTPLEQIRWAEGLPTRDDTLGNPARFDPNLDRQVSPEEFEAVIRQLAAVHTQPGTGLLRVSDLYVEVERPRDLLAVGLVQRRERLNER